jgi:hypothetical protein
MPKPDDSSDPGPGRHRTGTPCRPVPYVASVDEKTLAALDENPHLATVRRIASEEGAEIVALCAQMEAELLEPRMLTPPLRLPCGTRRRTARRVGV